MWTTALQYSLSRSDTEGVFRFCAAASIFCSQSCQNSALGNCFYCPLPQQALCPDFWVETAAQHKVIVEAVAQNGKPLPPAGNTVMPDTYYGAQFWGYWPSAPKIHTIMCVIGYYLLHKFLIILPGLLPKLYLVLLNATLSSKLLSKWYTILTHEDTNLVIWIFSRFPVSAGLN